MSSRRVVRGWDAGAGMSKRRPGNDRRAGPRPPTAQVRAAPQVGVVVPCTGCARSRAVVRPRPGSWLVRGLADAGLVLAIAGLWLAGVWLWPVWPGPGGRGRETDT